IGTQGVVELKGTKPAELTAVALANNTTLGKTDKGKFSLNNITLKQGGNITGGRLFGNTVTVNSAASGKANNLYGNQLTVAGAKTKTLDVNSGASKISAQHAATDMVWSNEYQSDTACGNTASCAKQYLLKEKGAAVQDCSTPPNGVNRKVLKTCSAGGTLYGTWSVSSCDYVPDPINIRLHCLTLDCVNEDTWEDADSPNLNQLRKLVGGCRLPKSSPTGVELYYKTLNKTSWSRWGQMAPGELYSWEDGWNMADGNFYRQYMRSFALDAKGNTRVTKQIGDCEYEFEVYTEQQDEDYNSTNCTSAVNWKGF
ncbi:MAG: hypothetical protein ACI37O_04990, partial [Candidatus Avelusimicrobium sp.]|uniref:hypothetical protein n=1 Tax=Candidatus Avelusimicrobium sp. TaxID=3048833 RepID=UPI003F114C10